MLECNKCNTLKPTTEYYYTGLGKRKYQYSCKPCTLEQKSQTYSNKRAVKFTKNDNKSGYQRTQERVPRIYFMYNKSELVYIGLSTSLASRLTRHKSNSPFFKYVTHIEVATLDNPIEMAVYELLLINHFKPRYNKHTYEGNPPYPIPTLDFKPWPLP